MWVVQINGIDNSCHTQECDAIWQKAENITNGIPEEDMTIVEKATFGA